MVHWSTYATELPKDNSSQLRDILLTNSSRASFGPVISNDGAIGTSLQGEVADEVEFGLGVGAKSENDWCSSWNVRLPSIERSELVVWQYVLRPNAPVDGNHTANTEFFDIDDVVDKIFASSLW